VSAPNGEGTGAAGDGTRASHGDPVGAGTPLDPNPQHGHAPDAPYEPVFVGARRTELDRLLTRYPTKMAALLPALWMVQETHGWVSDAAMAEVAELLDLTPAYVKGVVTFYTMYHQHPVGRHFVQVCTTTPCHVCGAEDVVKALLEQTGCGELGATSPDGRFTVIEVECLGACGFATPLMINERFVESVTVERVPALLRELD
jgi:NADH-quinone oxidoreductase E subunit